MTIFHSDSDNGDDSDCDSIDLVNMQLLKRRHGFSTHTDTYTQLIY